MNFPLMSIIGINFSISEDHFILHKKSAFFFIGHKEKVYLTFEEITRELRKIIKP